MIVQVQPALQESDFETDIPVLVVMTYSKGRISAFVSDLVPHLCGGTVIDWGKQRIEKDRSKFGHQDVVFVSQLMAWTSGLAMNRR